MLFRLLDSDIEGVDRVRDPHASFGGWPPAARPSGSSLIAEPTDPHDPLWSIMGYPWARPPAPVPGWPYQIGWPGPWYPNTSGRGPRLPPIMPLPATPHGGDGAASMRPLPFWLEPPNRATAAQARVVPGLDALLAMDDDAESASAPVTRADSAFGWPETDDFSRAPEETPLSGRSDMAQAQAGGAPSPTRPSLEYAIDQIERNYRNIPPGWRKQGLTEAATNLEWFLDGSGDTRFLHRDHARRFQPIREGQDSIESQVVGSLVGSGGHAKKLLDIKDGDSILFEDKTFKRDFKDWDFVRHLANPDTRDFALAFGNTTLESKAHIGATRVGDEVHVEGTVDYQWPETYVFYPDRYLDFGGFAAKGAAALEQHRGAKPFAIRSSWPRRFKGKIRIENGVLKNPVFEWEDIDQ
jgi:hypothetical protein